jgi:hypothetical protein
MSNPLAMKNNLIHFSKPCFPNTGNAIRVDKLKKMYPIELHQSWLRERPAW